MTSRTLCDWAIFGALALSVACRASSGSGDLSESEENGVSEDSRLLPPVVEAADDVVVETFAGSATEGSADGVGAAAQFSNPVGALVSKSGALLVTEYDGGRLRRISPGGETTTLAVGLMEPFALVETEDAIIVQSDRDKDGGKTLDTGTLWRIPLAGGTPEVLLEDVGRARGLARLPDGRIALSNRQRHTITILNLEDRSSSLLAGAGEPGLVDGPGVYARFSEPYGIAALPDGSLVVADSMNHVIRKVTLDGQVSIFAGDGKPGMRDDADKLRARFDMPVDVAVDVAGNVFVSDRANYRIRRITSAGAVETVAGDGSRGFADGVGPLSRFYGQEQLDVSPDGKTLFVSDGNGGDARAFHRIRRVILP